MATAVVALPNRHVAHDEGVVAEPSRVGGTTDPTSLALTLLKCPDYSREGTHSTKSNSSSPFVQPCLPPEVSALEALRAPGRRRSAGGAARPEAVGRPSWRLRRLPLLLAGAGARWGAETRRCWPLLPLPPRQPRPRQPPPRPAHRSFCRRFRR
jgi:hypothetical protein